LYEIQSVEERSSSDSDLENLLKQSELAFKTVIETGLANVNHSLASTLNRESTSTPINPPILDPLDPADDLFDEASVEGDNDHRHNSFLGRVNISDLSSIEIPKDSDSSEESDNSTHSNIILNFGNILNFNQPIRMAAPTMQDWQNFADANAQAIADGMNNLNAVTIKREIPEFSGEFEDGVTIDEWLRTANRVAKTAQWTNAQK